MPSLLSIASERNFNFYNVGTVSGAVTLNCANGPRQSFTTSGTVNLTYPINPEECAELLILVVAGGAHALKLEIFDIPSDSGFTGTKDMVNGQRYLLKLAYINSNWRLVSLIGGY
jgi:hypothetical protein